MTLPHLPCFTNKTPKTFMTTIISPQEAIKRVTSGHLCQLKGLDAHAFTHVFDNAKEVILLTFFQNDQSSLVTVIEKNEAEILEFADKAKAAMLQLVCGKGHDLSMDDMTVIKMVENIFPENTDFSWDVEHTDSREYMLHIKLYVIT